MSTAYADEYYEEEVYEEEVIDDDEYYEEVEEEEEDDDDDAPAAGGMAAMIAAAASKRNKRIDDGGPKKVTEVKKPLPPPKPDTSSMAAMVAQRANQRNERVEAGGEIQVREIPKEHKNVFVSVAAEAANVGNLTKLKEHAVEAVAAAKEEEVWAGPGGLRTDNIRSQMFMVINEAAAMGAMRRLKPVETTNYDTNVIEEEEELPDVDKLTDEHGRRVVRTEYLLDHAVEEERREKKQQWAAENQVTQYNSIEEVVLPSRKLPGFKPKKTQMTQKETMDAIALAVAERAWERNYRLNRPKANLRVTRKCNCKFCYNPNPFQTHKYKQYHEAGYTEVEGEKVLEEEKVDPTKKKWEPPKRTPPPPDFRGLSTTRNLKPATERAERPKLKPVPLPNRPTSQRLKPVAPPPPATQPAPAPAPEPVPEPEPEPEWEDTGGPRVLLDETVTYGHKRVKSKPKKDKDKKKKKKKKKGKGKDGDCILM